MSLFMYPPTLFSPTYSFSFSGLYLSFFYLRICNHVRHDRPLANPHSTTPSSFKRATCYGSWLSWLDLPANFASNSNVTIHLAHYRPFSCSSLPIPGHPQTRIQMLHLHIDKSLYSYVLTTKQIQNKYIFIILAKQFIKCYRFDYWMASF